MAFDIEGARKAGYTDAEIADYLGGQSSYDVRGARSSGYSDGEIIAHLAQGQTPPERPGIADRVGDIFTGNLRTTPDVEAAETEGRTLYDMPETNELSLGLVKAAVGGLLASSRERGQIFAANFPGVQVREDEKGNTWLQSAQNGQWYVIPPGFRAEDTPRAIAGIAAFTPAGRATTIPGAALAAGGTQAAIEASQAATGGEFNPRDAALAAAFGGGAQLAARGVSAGRQAFERVAQRAASDVPPVAGAPAAAPGTPPPSAPPPAPATPPAPPMSAADLAQTARQAAMGNERAAKVLADQAASNPETVAAARRLGIEDYLQPDHVTTNQAYRELAQAVKSVPGSETRAAEMQGLQQAGQRAEQLIEELGGTSDASALSAVVRQRMQATQQQLTDQSEKLYGEVRAAISPRTEAPAKSTLDFLRQHADDLGGAERLLPIERKLLADLSGEKPVTYAYLDQTRKQIGQAMRSASGPFADSESGLLKRLYGALSDDQFAVAQLAGAGDIYRAAQSAVAVRKSLEDDLTSLFGKTLDGSIAASLPGAVGALVKGDSSKLVRLIQAVPPDLRQQVVVSGIGSSFRNAATRGPITWSTYARWYEGLQRNRQAYAAVMSQLPLSARKQFHALYRVARDISAASRERITTGRLQVFTEGMQDADRLVQRIYETAKQNVTSTLAGAAAATATAPILGPGAAGVGAAVSSALAKGAKPKALQAADQLISSPDFIQMARQGGNAAALRRFAYSKAMNRYARALGNPRDMSDRERWVISAIQAQNSSQSRQ